MRRLLALALVLLMIVPFVSAEGESNGPLGWAQSAGGFSDEYLAGHVVLDDNRVVVAGSFTSAAQFGEDGIEAEGMLGDTDMFIAIMNSSGNWTSASGFGSSNGADGIDGKEDNAGAYISQETLKKADFHKINPQHYLENNDSYSFFKLIDDLIYTSPTLTNVNDFRAVLIQP